VREEFPGAVSLEGFMVVTWVGGGRAVGARRVEPSTEPEEVHAVHTKVSERRQAAARGRMAGMSRVRAEGRGVSPEWIVYW
jgi:hypothetical protein